MRRFTFSRPADYITFLIASSSEKSVASALATETRLLVASDSKIENLIQNIDKSLRTSVERGMKIGFDQISQQLGDIKNEIGHLTTVMEWGFAELLSSLGEISASIEQLVKIAKTPTQVWSYEQYGIAREAFRRGHFEDAIDYLNRAIEGHGSNTGYRLEFRFHLLLGQIYLGSFANTSQEIVNLEMAEASFLRAARYAESASASAAGRVWLAAGWAACCRGCLENGLKYSLKARKLDPTSGEPSFQLGKIYAALGQEKECIESFLQALDLDHLFAIKVLGDEDYVKFEAAIANVIRSRLSREKALAMNEIASLESHFNFCKGLETSGLSVREFSPQLFDEARTDYEVARKCFHEGSLLSVIDGRTATRRAQEKISKAEADSYPLARNKVKSRKNSIERSLSDSRDKLRENCLAGRVFGGIAGIFMGHAGCKEVVSSTDGATAFFGGLGTFIGLIFIGVVLGHIYVAVFSKEKIRIREAKSALTEAAAEEEKILRVVERNKTH